MADVPGLIEGAATGAGLGIRFLKHLTRTHLLLHLLDMGPDADPVSDARTIESELRQFDAALAGRERWLVLNKIDLLPEEMREARCRQVVEALHWEGPVYALSALSRSGTQQLVQAVMTYVERSKHVEQAAEHG
jgi:GTP-binding protein